jgi:S1-C subfamily serine protease
MSRLILRLSLIVALLSIACAIAAPRTVGAQEENEENKQLSTPELVDRVAPAVVTVINGQVTDTSSDGAVPAASGTGFIVNDNGRIITNQHVVADGDEFVVIFMDGTERKAELLGADPISDLAVLDIDGDIPATVELGDSSDLEVGQPVVAIGSPLGAFTNTVTDGIISALGRDFPGSPFYTNLIQHTAPINPGNSGGPLFNQAGAVIGVNTLGVPEAQGIFFAIPSNTVDRIVNQIAKDGVVVYPYFGVEGAIPVTSQVAATNDLEVDHGVLVEDVVPGGPADEAGIRPGDVILAVDGQEIDQQTTFTEALFVHDPGETVPVTIQRGAEELTVEVTLGERPSDL